VLVRIQEANVCVSRPAPFVPLNVATPKTHKASQSFRIEPSPGQGRLSHRDPQRGYAVLASRTLPWPTQDRQVAFPSAFSQPDDESASRLCRDVVSCSHYDALERAPNNFICIAFFNFSSSVISTRSFSHAVAAMKRSAGS